MMIASQPAHPLRERKKSREEAAAMKPNTSIVARTSALPVAAVGRIASPLLSSAIP